MEPKKGLSKREKVLLIFMGVIGVTALLVVFIILPTLEQIQANEDLYQELSMEQMQIEMLLARAPAIHEVHEEAALQHEISRARFLTEAHLSGVGRMLSRLCEEHDLAPIDQRLSDPVAFQDGELFLIVTADMNVTGEYTALRNLLDTVEQTEYLRISRLSFPIEEGPGVLTDRITIRFEVAMMAHLDLEAAVAAEMAAAAAAAALAE